MQIKENKQIEEYYDAVKNRDTNFIGSFFFGVKTTGIFCIPSCRARTPKPENLVYYTQVDELLAEGFRPCKLCKPTINAYETPIEIKKAIRMVHQSPFEKIKDTHLLENDIRPEKLRRWFKKNYGITFHAYQRMHRINSAYQDIKKGKGITKSAFDSGYESLSGFTHTFKALLGKASNIIHIKRITTPIGPMFIAASEKGICMLQYVDQKTIEDELIEVQKLMNASILVGGNKHIQKAEFELKKYFSGEQITFSTPLDVSQLESQHNFIRQLRQISFGQTKTYTDISKQLKCGKEQTQSLIYKNKIAIIVPCHRVICESGDLFNYSGGLERKRWLLEHEKRNK